MKTAKSAAVPSTRADLIFVYAAYTLRYVYLLVLIPFYGRVLGVDGYAVVLSSMSLMNMVWLLVGWGFATSGLREIASLTPDKYPAVFSQQLSARLILSVVALVGGTLAVFSSPVLSDHFLASFSALALGIVSAFNIGWYFMGAGRPRDSVKLEVLGFCISLGLILMLVRAPDDTAVVMMSLLLSASVALALAHWWAGRTLIRDVKIHVKSGAGLIYSTTSIFLYSGSLIFLGASSTYILGLFSSQADVGIFGAAERLVSVGLSVMVPTGQIFIPKIISLYAKDEAAAFRLVRKAFALLGMVAAVGCVLCVVIPHLIIRLIFGQGFELSAELLRLYSPVFLLNSIIIVVGGYIMIPLRKERLLAQATLSGVCANVLLSLFLAPKFGATGMVVARLIGDFLIVVVLMVVMKKMNLFSKLFK